MELHADSEKISNGIVNKRVVELPRTDQRPFALHLKEGGLMLFWAPTAAERENWIQAFKSIQVTADLVSNSHSSN